MRKKKKIVTIETRYGWDDETRSALLQVRFRRADGSHTKTRTFTFEEAAIVHDLAELSVLLVAVRAGVKPVGMTEPEGWGP